MISKKIFLPLILPFFLVSCGDEYWAFHDEQKSFALQKAQTELSRENFSVEQIADREVEVLMTPDKKILDRIVAMIDTAKTRVDVEVYILTEKRIIKALQDAKKRGVDVRVLLEKNVFGATSINSKSFKALTGSGVSVTYDNSDLYNFVHTKLLLIDDTYIITTGNLSYASFAYNREMYVIGRNPSDRETLGQIFSADFSGQEIVKSTSNLVISPIDSRAKIETLFQSATKDILIYAQTMDDPVIMDILAEKRRQKIPVTICIADPKKIKSNTETIAKLSKKGVDIRASKKPVIHAKSALVDSKYSYIGSENFTTNSLDNNREIGILLKTSPDFVEKWRGTFESDCPNTTK
ncbi:MAG: phospholipase D-like domain-containing protein [Candidatus Gracilibacteria bacterium]|nr:phospholipase D-like domain-containing protein [Candidatus Gracilibacteria bacterium]